MNKPARDKMVPSISGIEALPPEIRDHYHEVIHYHSKLLKRLAQK